MDEPDVASVPRPFRLSASGRNKIHPSMKHPRRERDVYQGSDAPDESLDTIGLALNLENAEMMARQIAAHL